MTSGAWYDEQRRVTPDQVEAAAFPLTRWGKQGYDVESVRAFLAEVQAEFVRLVNERSSLWQEVQRLRRRILGKDNGKDAAVLFGEDDAHIHAVRILANAQMAADRCVADAQAYSGRVTAEARTRREEIITQAQQHSEMLLEEARARAREAAIVAMNHEPLQPASEQERRAVQGEVAYLRTFNEVYRTHLKVYTQTILSTIEDWENKESGLRTPVSDHDLLGALRRER